MSQVGRTRTLGDKLQFLAALSHEEIRQIEILVDYRIKILGQEEYDRIRAASKPVPALTFHRRQ